MAYLILLLSVCLSVTFNQTLRVGQRFNAGVLAAGAVNYVIAAAVSVVALFFSYGGAAAQVNHAGAMNLSLAAMNGGLFFIHLLVILRCFQWAGVGITMAVTGSGGALLPVLISWLCWSEPMGVWRWTAVGLLPVAMFLMRPQTEAHPHLTLRGDLALIGTFCCAGTISTLLKHAQIHAPDGLSAYQAVLFCAAAVTSVSYVAWNRMKIGRVNTLLGLILGLCNAANTGVTIYALTMMSAVIFFPSTYCMAIVAHAIASRLAWKEQLRRRQIVGMVAALAVIVLTNMR